MCNYTQEETNNLNKQLKKWQNMQLRIVRKGIFDNDIPFNDIEKAVWEQIAKAKTHLDVNVIAWNMADKVINKFRKVKADE